MGDNHFTSFLRAAFGQTEAEVLVKAAEDYSEIKNALFPRAVLAWVLAHEAGFNGRIPGTDVETRFQKSEDGYIGQIKMDGRNYEFNSASDYQLAATIAVAIGADVAPLGYIPAEQIQKLGKSLDLMAKAKHLLKKADAPGAHAPAIKPLEPLKPLGALAPTKGLAKKPKLKLPKMPGQVKAKAALAAPAMPAIKVEKSEYSRTCFRCDNTLIIDGVITCTCVAPMVKSLHTEEGPAGSVLIRLGPEISRFDLVRLVEVFKLSKNEPRKCPHCHGLGFHLWDVRKGKQIKPQSAEHFAVLRELDHEHGKVEHTDKNIAARLKSTECKACKMTGQVK